MTDAGGSDKLCNDHGLCERGDKRAVTMLALTAGNDVEMGGGSLWVLILAPKRCKPTNNF